MSLARCLLLSAACAAAGCSRTEAPPPAPAPAAAIAPAPETAPAPAPAPRADAAALSSQAWRVTASSPTGAGSLYVFLPGGTLLVATPGSPVAQGEWRIADGRLTMVEESRPYAVDVLEQQERSLRLRSHNPGTPVDLVLAAVDAAAPPVPERFRGDWAARREDCRRPGEPTRLQLAADTVRFHESSGAVLAAVPDPADASRLDVVARLTGEGSTRLAWRRFRLGPDGTSLSDVTEGKTGGLVRVRC